MYRKSFTLLLVGSTLVSSTSLAGENAYMCQVAHVYTLSDSQQLTTSPALEAVMKERPFSVSRETGQVVAETAIDTSRAKEVRVLNAGSRDNSFKAIADFGRFPNGTRPFQLLEIQEFVVGAIKPFLIKNELGVITGTCT